VVELVKFPVNVESTRATFAILIPEGNTISIHPFVGKPFNERKKMEYDVTALTVVS
jgi:hypothetical protein